MFYTSELAKAHIADLLAEAEEVRRANLARGPRVSRTPRFHWHKFGARHGLRHEVRPQVAQESRVETAVYCRRAAGHTLVHGGAR